MAFRAGEYLGPLGSSVEQFSNNPRLLRHAAPLAPDLHAHVLSKADRCQLGAGSQAHPPIAPRLRKARRWLLVTLRRGGECSLIQLNIQFGLNFPGVPTDICAELVARSFRVLQAEGLVALMDSLVVPLPA